MDYKKILEQKKFLLLNEYKQLKDLYIDIAKKTEFEKIAFAKKNIVQNKKTGEMFIIKADFKSYIKTYFNTIIQRLIYNKQIAKENNLIPFFVTFTAPSDYHPFKTFGKKTIEEWELNENFAFNSLKEASYLAYKKLNEIFRYFYLTLKTGNKKLRKHGKDVKYNAFHEYHKTFIPHLHFLVYVPEEIAKNWIYQTYNKTLEKFNMNKKSNKIIEITAVNEMEEVESEDNNLDSLDGAVLYISKYISKNLKDIMEIPEDLENLNDILDNETFEKFKQKEQNLYLYMGWKIFNNIRIFRGNNTGIGIANYKKIYTSLTPEEKEELLKKAKENKTCLLYEIEKNTYRYTEIIKENGEIVKKDKCKKDYSAKFFIKEVKERREHYNFIGIYNFFKLFYYFNKLNKNNKLIQKMKLDYLNYEKNITNMWDFAVDEVIEEHKNNAVNSILMEANLFVKTFKNEFAEMYFDDDNELIYFKRIINRELNKKQNSILRRFINTFLKKEDKYKKFISEMLAVVKSASDIAKTIKNEFLTLISDLNDYINDKIDFNKLFFYYNYKTIEYFIEKDYKEIYNKNDYELVHI